MNFPALKNKIYFDTARSGLMYDELRNWRNSHENHFLKEGSQFRLNDEELLNETRLEINKFFNSPKSRTFLIQNFSIGLSKLLNSLKSNQSVMIIKDDYSSIIDQVRCSGLPYFFIKNTFDLELQILNEIKKKLPDVLIFSIVQHIDGTLIDLDFIKKIKNEFPEILIIADGTQFCGTKFFDFKNSNIDILISSGYKWMLGGYGNGFISINSFCSSNHFKMDINSYNLSLIFEPGHLDTLSFGSLLFSLKTISNYGIKNIESDINRLSNYAKSSFENKELLNLKVVKRKKHSNIFNIEGNDSFHKHLIKNKIICSKRGDGIRFSFNFYNTISEIDDLLSLL